MQSGISYFNFVNEVETEYLSHPSHYQAKIIIDLSYVLMVKKALLSEQFLLQKDANLGEQN